MRLRNLTFSGRPGERRAPASATLASLAAPAAATPGVDPEISTIRDQAIFLLHVAAEVEHALLIQYLYALFTAPAGATTAWVDDMWDIAIQEMGHLITIQNVLTALRAPLNLEREDYPFRRGYYPFEFSLEPFSLKTLARYTLAEMPETGHGLAPQQLADLRKDAQTDAGGVTSVGKLYAQLISVIGRVDAIDFLGDPGFAYQAAPTEWQGSESDDPDAIIVRRIKSRDDAERALHAVAIQGEGDGLTTGSHFHKFWKIYSEFKAAPLAVADIASNPNTSGQEPGGEITDPRTRDWAHLFNLQYRLLLHGIAHSLRTPASHGARKVLVTDVAFRHMHRVADIAEVLTSLPLKSGGSTNAGPPFELPYLLSASTDDLGNWLTLRDILAASGSLASQLLASEQDATRQEKLRKLIPDPTKDPWRTVDARIAELTPKTEILELRLLPSLAIGRFGSSPDPMDNYEILSPPGTGPRTLAPAETLTVDPLTGLITGAATPAAVRFRDSAGAIRPVSPFLEVWARFSAGGQLEPLTVSHLESLGLTPANVQWFVEVGNLKAFRRTGVEEDKILASVTVNGHARAALAGRSPNFKAGKTMPFGHVQYVQPNPAFPEIRFRFTPSVGKVYGPVSGDPNIADDVYDSSRGSWDNYVEAGGAGTTVPGGIFAGTFNSQTQTVVSRGYLDDSCDGIVTVSIALASGKTVTAFARIASGPPDFAPAAVPVRTVGDELVQAAEGPEAASGTKDETAEIVRRALDTVRLLETRVMNGNQGIGGVPQSTNNMPGHDTNYDRAFEPIFPPQAADPALVVARHENVLRAIGAGTPVSVSPRLRPFDSVGDLSNEGRQRMPAMMRGADGKHLALTRRQVSIVRRYEESIVVQPPQLTPRDAMIRLVEHLRDTAGAAQFHGNVPAGAGPLRDLFADPPKLLDFLVNGNSKGSFGLPAGQPLVVKGNAGASALVTLIRGNNFMAGNFKTAIATIENKTGVEIVEAWINSLS